MVEVTAGNERIAARYSEDGGAKAGLESLGEPSAIASGPPLKLLVIRHCFIQLN